jgi:hypothetical protein
MEGEAHVGDEQVANKNQRVSKPLTGDRHHEHGVMNTFNAEATRTWCKEVTKRVFGHRFVFIIDIVKFFTATKKNTNWIAIWKCFRKFEVKCIYCL